MEGLVFVEVEVGVVGGFGVFDPEVVFSGGGDEVVESGGGSGGVVGGEVVAVVEFFEECGAEVHVERFTNSRRLRQ